MDANIDFKAGLLAALVAAAAAAPFAATAADNTFVYDDISGWTIRTDADRDYRCFAEAEYFNGAVVRAGFNSEDGSFYMSVGEYSWDWVRDGASYDVTVGFDDGSEDRFKATGTMLEGDYAYPSVRVNVPAEKQAEFIQQFMDRREMHIAHGDDVALTVGLHGTRRATRTLDECQLEMVSALQGSSSGDNASASLDE